MSLASGQRRPCLVGLAIAALVASGADAPDPRPMTLAVDAREAPRRVLHARLTIPAAPGPLALVYPKWLPGEHAPSGPVVDLAGLVCSAGGRPLAWTRDDEDMHKFHLVVPDGAESVEVALDFLCPSGEVRGFSAATSTTAKLAVLSWNHVLLYPAGRPVREIAVAPILAVPEGWTIASALTASRQEGGSYRFAPVSLETLVDSPVLCGEHLREVDLGARDGRPHRLAIAGDAPGGLDPAPGREGALGRLVEEVGALFGARHYEGYTFLLALSDHITHFGLEHHESSDNRLGERALVDPDRKEVALLLPHEYVHSWNGKYRRPADMIAEDFQAPQRTRLLWVYEGLTDYLALVLAARSGLIEEDEARDLLAIVAEGQRNQRGRSWRPLDDTAASAQLLYNARRDGASWRRYVDFYKEGILLWLEVDTLIRETTRGRRSLDDFCRRFHGGASGPPAVVPYTFEDVVRALEEVAPHDWRALLTERVSRPAGAPPLEGLRRGGWRLGYADVRTEMQKALEDLSGEMDLSASLGLILDSDGGVVDVIPGEAAARAGIGPGMKVVAVNGRRFSPRVLRSALADTVDAAGPLELLVENDEFFRTHALDARGGGRHPRLERIEGSPDRLTDILRPRAGGR